MRFSHSSGGFILAPRAALILLALLYGSSGCRADEAQRANRDSLRYEGKNFRWWANELKTELKAERRVEAIRAMGAFGTNGYAQEAATAIITVVKRYDVESAADDDQIVIAAAEKAFRRIGPSASQPLIRALGDADQAARRYSAIVLKQVRPGPSAVTALVAATKDTDPHVRRIAVVALARNADPATARPAVAALIAALGDDDLETRRFAAQAMGEIGASGTRATSGLISALKDGHPHVRRDAVEALGQIRPNPKRITPAAVRALEAEDRELVVPALVEALQDTDREVRQNAINILGRIGAAANAAVPALVEAFPKENLHDRYLVARTLGMIGPGASDALPVLTKALQDDDPNLQKMAGQALEKITK